MKRFICCVLLALTILPLTALGEEMPQEVKTLYQADAGGVETASDVLNLRDAAGSAWCLIAGDGGETWGYRQNASGEWACEWSGSLWPDGGDARFVREGETAFRVESESLDAWMRYESRGAGFYLTAWRDGGAYRGYAVISDGEVTFFPDGGGEKEVIPIGEELKNWLYAFDSLAKTPEEMRARAAIGREAAAALLPGWTMAWYESFNDGTEADAAFYRVENGRLTVRRMSLSSEKGKIWETESLAVPLSAALLQRLETEGAAGLLDGSGYGSTFLTEDAWDREIIPIQGKILANDLQSHCLLALTEREGERRVAVAEMDEKGVWQVRESRPLPAGAGLDLFHSGDGELCVKWMRGDGECQCGFVRQADGQWRMAWAWAGEGDYALSWYGLCLEWDGPYAGVYAYGTPGFADLFEADLTALPASGEKAAAQMDTAGWAAVMNPDPEDRLHLRSEPGKNGDSLGKFYNGTPLRVLEEKGDWARVRVGMGDCLEGWMMREYLAVDGALQRVRQAFPELFLREEFIGRRPLRIDGGGEAEFALQGGEAIVGIRQETRQWIVMTGDGRLCLAPLDWFWEGNG